MSRLNKIVRQTMLFIIVSTTVLFIGARARNLHRTMHWSNNIVDNIVYSAVCTTLLTILFTQCNTTLLTICLHSAARHCWQYCLQSAVRHCWQYCLQCRAALCKRYCQHSAAQHCWQYCLHSATRHCWQHIVDATTCMWQYLFTEKVPMQTSSIYHPHKC